MLYRENRSFGIKFATYTETLQMVPRRPTFGFYRLLAESHVWLTQPLLLGRRSGCLQT
jgi:hypothetical protein